MARIITNCICLLLVVHSLGGAKSSWEEWWTYDGISGPDYWGLLNPEWKLCNRGRRQSPININTDLLLYDPGLGRLVIGDQRVSGFLKNNGHSVRFVLDPTGPPVLVTGGPLSYKFRVAEVLLHFGRSMDKGSEHTVSGHAFAAEIQVLSYNYQLYENLSEATPKTQGVLAIAVVIQLANISSPDMKLMTSELPHVIHKGQKKRVYDMSIYGMLPDSTHYMTYEGSTTMPGCHETVTWIVLNKPVYMTKGEIMMMRQLMQGDEKNPKTPLANNFRPPQPLFNRSVRTNVINHQVKPGTCFNDKLVTYRAHKDTDIYVLQLKSAHNLGKIYYGISDELILRIG